jgi:hypothetical protein
VNRAKSKKETRKAPESDLPRPALSTAAPRLERLGSLTELTRGMGGLMMDGGSGMSKA